MDWFIYALITAILAAGAAIVQKKVLIKEHAMEFATTLAAVTMVVASPFFLVIDYSTLEFVPLIILFFDGIVCSFALLLVVKGVRHMEVSDSSPLLVLGPAVTAFIAYIFLGEKLTGIQIGGVGLLIIGAFILETKRHHSLLESFKIFKKSKYVHYIFLALVLYGVGGTIDRLLLGSYNMQPEVYISFIHVFIAIDFVIISSLFHDGLKGVKRALKKARWWFFLVAIFTFGYRLAQAEAVALVNVGLVSAIKRSSALFATIIGGELFHEKNLFRKTVACLIMIGGVILIVI